MASEEHVRQALKIGEEQATLLMERRAEMLDRRSAAVRTRGPAAMAHVGSPFEGSTGAATAGVLVAEGDSWFDYPFHDVLKNLEDQHAFDVESVAHRGDAIEEMAYGGGQLDELIRLLEKLNRREVKPKAILLSGGGNDLAGDEFAMLLNHALSPIAGLSPAMIDAVIDQRIHTAYTTILSAVTKVCDDTLGHPIPVVVHGYDYPVPDDRGFLGGWSFLPGPWLGPSFREKGFQALNDRKAMMVTLIDRFNDMLQAVVAIPAFAHVHYLDLRNTLSTAPADYEDWWANELHPTKRGFRAVSDRFAVLLGTV
ncbi:MAG: SGNH/GDSL hydrolase family protein [Acidobacteria bacterium]|nr:SGNH/GDSL hydrolase family protein [Acidobacteriota bacterium]